MIKIKNTEVFGLERAVKAISNSFISDINTVDTPTEKNWERAVSLGHSKPGLGHDGYLKGINVTFDIIYPQYWTPEAQRYGHFDIIMSTSKIHSLIKVGKKEDFNSRFNKYVDEDIINRVTEYAMNYDKYEKEKDEDKKYYWFMKCLSNLPMGYELQMTVTTNYLQLKTMFLQRKGHKLKEDWGEFCKWCVSLPKFTELTGCSLD